MARRIGSKLVGAALSVAVLGGCTTTPEGASTPTVQQQERHDTPDQRFTDAGRYITHIVTCIADDKRSKMTNLGKDQLDNTAEAFTPGGRGEQPVRIYIQRAIGLTYDGGGWTAIYTDKPAPGSDAQYAIEAIGKVPRDNAFWENAVTPDLSLSQAGMGGAEIAPRSLTIVDYPEADITVDKHEDGYYYTSADNPTDPKPLSQKDFDTFMHDVPIAADQVLEMSGVNRAACFPD